jgi:hypothetical protein
MLKKCKISGEVEDLYPPCTYLVIARARSFNRNKPTRTRFGESIILFGAIDDIVIVQVFLRSHSRNGKLFLGLQ